MMKMKTLLLYASVPMIAVLLTWTLIIINVNGAAAESQPRATTEPSARYGHTMVTIGNMVYLFGGDAEAPASAGAGSSSPEAANVILYNDLWSFVEVGNQWLQAIPNNAPPKARKNHSALSYGDKLDIFFGVSDGGQVLGDIWEYNTTTNTWTERTAQVGEQPAPRNDHASAVIGNVVYVYGGVNAFGQPADGYMWKYDLNSNQWVRGAPHPNGGRSGHTLTSVNGSLYLFGGSSDGQNPKNDLWRYDPPADSWTQITPQSNLPPARTTHIATLDANKIMISGGRGQAGELGDVWKYDIVSNQWIPMKDGPVQSHSAAVVLPSSQSGLYLRSSSLDSRLLFFGGLRNGQPIAETFIYFPWYETLLPLILR